MYRPSLPRLYILETNTVLLNYIQKFLSTHYSLQPFSEPASLVKDLATGKPNMILLAWDGVEHSLATLTEVLGAARDVPLILLSCITDVQEMALVTRLGARDVLLKPFTQESLKAMIDKHLMPVEVMQSGEAREIPIGEGRSFVRSSKRMRDLENQAALVARSDIPVLILGESGTGKEVLAMYVHTMSHRNTNMFLKVNCAAMPADLLESELFGYEQGAFTGALKTKPGKFETCSGGTIFLDEIGEMPAMLQAKLLHVLQDGTYSRLGSRTTMKSDVRVIAATNINIKNAIAQKTFREDLYYRLNGFSLTLPALRDRREEVPLLASYFMRKGAEKYGRDPLPFSTTLSVALTNYTWPGNLRELENVINRFLIMGDESSILSELSPPNHSESAEVADLPSDVGLKQIVRGLKGDAEAAAIANALEETRWNRKAAASNLKISYKALLYKIKDYGLLPPRS